MGREGLEPSSLGLKARCPSVERASLGDFVNRFVSSSFPFQCAEGHRVRPPAAFMAALENAPSSLRITTLAETPFGAARRTHVSWHPRGDEGQPGGL